MKKGLALPIEMIVIVAVALIVLVVVAAFFAAQFGTGANTIELQQAKSKACGALLSAYNCDPNAVNTIKITLSDGTSMTLMQLCQKEGITTKEACVNSCAGCKQISSGGTE